MAAVQAETGQISITWPRQVKLLRQGFTRFASGDVIFAKITPCMANGKIAVVPEVPLGLACGSTEFHVLKPEMVRDEVSILLAKSEDLSQKCRVQHDWHSGPKTCADQFSPRRCDPCPPRGTKIAVIARIDELFTDLDDGEAALARARVDLGAWRKALLKAAVTGELTADWRAANPPTETGADLLARILDERRARWLDEPPQRSKALHRAKQPRGRTNSHLSPRAGHGRRWKRRETCYSAASERPSIFRRSHAALPPRGKCDGGPTRYSRS